jgi:hypothetical protein
MIDGKLIDISGRAQLRVRYTTPYNFVVAANGSPINNSRFDKRLVELMDAALSSDAREVITTLSGLVDELPLRQVPSA